MSCPSEQVAPGLFAAGSAVLCALMECLWNEVMSEFGWTLSHLYPTYIILPFGHHGLLSWWLCIAQG